MILKLSQEDAAEEAVLSQVDRAFNEWAISGQMDSNDLGILKEILSGDEGKLIALLENYSNKVAIKAQDRKDPERNGRTVYLELEKPLPVPNGDIVVLRIKGARPYYKKCPSVIESHLGDGFVEHLVEVNKYGNPVMKKVRRYPKKESIYGFEWDPIALTPQGALLDNNADKEYRIMRAGIIGQGFETDYPIAVGLWKNKRHVGRAIGFVIAGMRSEDLRIEIQQLIDPNILLVNVVTGNIVTTSTAIAYSIYKNTLPPEAVASIITLVFVSYFNKKNGTN